MNVGQQELEDGLGGDVHFRVPAVPGRLAALRHALAEWADRIGLSTGDQEALVLATYEAMANSVEHAYPDQIQGVLEVRAHRDVEEGRAVVTVTDYGRWKPPEPSGGLRGRGLSLIRGLTATTTITPTPTGTTVAMSWPLPEEEPDRDGQGATST